jgi:hypothetical protein
MKQNGSMDVAMMEELSLLQMILPPASRFWQLRKKQELRWLFQQPLPELNCTANSIGKNAAYR